MSKRVEKPTQSLNGGYCPFRGMVRLEEGSTRVLLDDRCPTTVLCEQAYGPGTRFAESPETGETDWYGDPGTFVPILETESYCHGCIYDLVRERELGMKTTGLKKEMAQSGGRRRRRGRAR